MNRQAALSSFLENTGAMVASYLEACVHCGQCAHACIFYEASRDPRHTPIYKLVPLVRTYQRHKSPFAGLKRALGLAPAQVTDAELTEWRGLLYDTCTMCGRCTLACPMGIDIAALVALARRGMVAGGFAPEDLLAVARRAKTEGSPLGVNPKVLAERLEWLSDEYETDIPLDKPRANVLLTSSSIELTKYPESIAAMAKILNHAGESWTFSSKGYEATNFGVLSGDTEVANILVERLVEAAESVGAALVVLPECGHAYGVLRWSGANIIGRPLPFEVLHITEYMAKLKKEGRLRMKPIAESITYHDPCQVSRRGGATAAPRAVLEGTARDFREMELAGNANWCCGGGGGVNVIRSADEGRLKAFEVKMKQVDATGAETVVSACANCRMSLDDGKQRYQWQRKINNLAELVAEHLED